MYTDSIRFVATDAHRLVRYARTDATAAEPSSFIVPKKPLNLLKNAASSAEKVGECSLTIQTLGLILTM